MTKAIIIEATGGPEVMTWDDIELPPLEPGQVQIKHTAIGFNMIDTYYRKGLYPVTLPAVIGNEAAGVVEARAEDVDTLDAGDHVAYFTRPANIGTYCEQRVIDADQVIKLPDDIADEIAAAGMLKGLTAWALLRKTYPVKTGEAILVYAAAGGVGSILCQWAKHLGAYVIGVVGSPEKIGPARRNGCAEVIDRSQQDIVETVRKLTNGEGVQVVYDSLGKDTFAISLDTLVAHGLMVSYGNATGAVPPFDILELMRKGSLFLTRPQFAGYMATREKLEQAVAELFAVIRTGAVTIAINQRFDLKDAAAAHRAVESKTTTGSTILIP